LPDVTLLAVPDLPAIHASEPIGAKGQIPVIPSGPEQFVECSAADVTPAQQRAFENPAPRLAPAQYGEWSQSVKTIINYLAGGAEKQVPHLREIQFVAAFPLPLDLDVAAANENASSASLAQDIRDQVATLMPEQTEAESPGTLSSAFLQLSYPWLKTSGSSVLLQSLERRTVRWRNARSERADARRACERRESHAGGNLRRVARAAGRRNDGSRGPDSVGQPEKETADSAAKPVWVHAKRAATAIGRHVLSGRVIPARPREPPGFR